MTTDVHAQSIRCETCNGTGSVTIDEDEVGQNPAQSLTFNMLGRSESVNPDDPRVPNVTVPCPVCNGDGLLSIQEEGDIYDGTTKALGGLFLVIAAAFGVIGMLFLFIDPLVAGAMITGALLAGVFGFTGRHGEKIMPDEADR